MLHSSYRASLQLGVAVLLRWLSLALLRSIPRCKKLFMKLIHQRKEIFHLIQALAQQRHGCPRFCKRRFKPLCDSDIVANALGVVAKCIFKSVRVNFVVIFAGVFVHEHFANQIAFKERRMIWLMGPLLRPSSLQISSRERGSSEEIKSPTIWPITRLRPKAW